MQESLGRRTSSAPAVLGILLIAFGAAALILPALGFKLFTNVGAQDWPLLVIAPGVLLLAASLVPAPPRGIGFATGGAVVTTVGAILLYQSRTGNWESWAYAWALIPLGAGVATLLYGVFAGRTAMISAGFTMAGIAGALFLAGAWFFEGVFAGEPRPTDVGAWWPIGVIVLGGVIVLRAVLLPASRSSSSGESVEGPARPADQAHVA
jgi:hypothetical protein